MEPIILGSGPDGRLVAEFLANKHRWSMDYRCVEDGQTGIPGLLLHLARKHKRPVREIKALTREYQKQQHPAGAMFDKSVAEQERYADQVCGCGATEDLTWRSSPYLMEIMGNGTKRWMCPRCVNESAMDI